MRSDVIERARNTTWFNGMDFGDLVTYGREGESNQFPNWSLYPTFDLLQKIDLRGKRCIDIGSGSGLVALGMAKLGASYVAAVDALNSDAFRIAIELTGHDVDYRIVDVADIAGQKDWLNSFDVVVCSGLMYHLISPFQVVHAAKKIIKTGGVFILQSMTAGRGNDDGRGAFYTNTYKSLNGEPTTFLAPTISAIRGMVDLGLFDRRLERTVQKNNGEFHAVLSISRDSFSTMTNVPLATMKTFNFFEDKIDYPYGGYSLKDFLEIKPVSDLSSLHFEAGIETINIEKFNLTFPYAPKARRS